MTALVPKPSDLADSRALFDRCVSIDKWAAKSNDVPALHGALAGLAAIDEYLDRTSMRVTSRPDEADCVRAVLQDPHTKAVLAAWVDNILAAVASTVRAEARESSGTRTVDGGAAHVATARSRPNPTNADNPTGAVTRKPTSGTSRPSTLAKDVR